MTQATREALEQVSRILHDAGWDQAPEPTDEVAPWDEGARRQAYELAREALGRLNAFVQLDENHQSQLSAPGSSTHSARSK